MLALSSHSSAFLLVGTVEMLVFCDGCSDSLFFVFFLGGVFEFLIGLCYFFRSFFAGFKDMV